MGNPSFEMLTCSAAWDDLELIDSSLPVVTSQVAGTVNAQHHTQLNLSWFKVYIPPLL